MAPNRSIWCDCDLRVESQGPPNGGVSNGGGFPIWTCPSFWSFPCPSFPRFFGFYQGKPQNYQGFSVPAEPSKSWTLRGFSRFVLFLFLGLLTAPTRNSPEGVCDTIWTFSEKSGKPPGLASPKNRESQITSGLKGSALRFCCDLKRASNPRFEGAI